MPSVVVNIASTLKAYPYTGPGSGFLGQNGVVVPTIPTPISKTPPGPIVAPGIPTTPPLAPKGIQGGQWYPLELKTVDVNGVIKFFSGTLSTLDKVTKFLSPILNLLELYLSSFSSFASALKSGIEAIQKILKRYEQQTGTQAHSTRDPHYSYGLSYNKNKQGLGVYMNVMVPPAFLSIGKSNFRIGQMYSGGFQGFLGRLQISLNDVNDTRRPDFPNTEDVVGGAIILVDTDSIGKFFRAWKQLMNLLGQDIYMTPPPPRNIRGRSGYFDDGTGKQKFGIQLDWDAPAIPSDSFQIYRSTVSGGQPKVVDDIPTNIKDLIKVTSKMIATRKAEFPKKLDKSYDDPDFKGPHTVLANFATGGGSYIDYDIPGLTGTGQAATKGPELDPLHPFIPDHQRYYYVIKSSSIGIVGAPSQEARVVVKTCDNSFNTAVAIEHSTGAYELLSDGFSELNKWSSKRMSNIAPWVPATINYLNKLLESIQGKIRDSSESFSNFVKQITTGIQNSLTVLKIIQTFVVMLKQFVIGSEVAFLWVPPVKGGSSGFIQRVRNAKLSPGQQPFSGPDGITAGVIFMFGYSAIDLKSLSAAEQAAFKTQFDAISTSFKAMTSLFTK